MEHHSALTFLIRNSSCVAVEIEQRMLRVQVGGANRISSIAVDGRRKEGRSKGECRVMTFGWKASNDEPLPSAASIWVHATH